MLHFGHSSGPGDIAVYDPRSRTLFAGGLLDARRIPDVIDSDLVRWTDALRSLQALPLEVIVPGHGPSGSKRVITQVERYLAVADFGVLTSLHEGLSNTLLEYMAAGLPVLGSQVSGTEDFVITGRTGWLFPPADVRAFARCLSETAEADIEELHRRGREARALVDERASIRSVVGQLERAYDRISAVPA